MRRRMASFVIQGCSQSDEDRSNSNAEDYRREPVAQNRNRQDLESPEEVMPMNSWR